MAGDAAKTPTPRTVLLAMGLGLLVQLVVSAPFLGSSELFVRHFDAPAYLVVARTLYVPADDTPLPGYVQGWKPFAASLPAYPLAIRLFSILVGYPGGLLAASALFAALAAAASAAWLSEVAPEVPALTGILAFLLLPPRFVLYRALGSAEGAMVFFVLLVCLAYHRGRAGWAFAAAAASSVTRISGVVVIAVLAAAYFLGGKRRTALVGGALALVPLLLLFAWWGRVLDDPLAYFHVAGGGHLPGGPFALLFEVTERNEWQTAELIIAVFLFYGLAAARLWALGYRLEAGLVGAHVAFFSIVREMDMPRFFLTVAPFAFVLAWKEVFVARRLSAIVLTIAAPVSIAYAWASIPNNLLHPFSYQHLMEFLGR